MPGRAVFIIAALALVPIALVLLLRETINAFYAKTEGVFASIALIVSMYIAIGQYYYLKSERFYLWVQRLMLAWRRVHTFWRFTVAYTGVNELFAEGQVRTPEFQKQLVGAFAACFPGKPIIHTALTNALSITVDDVDRFDFSFDFERDQVNLQTSKMRVPSHIYWTFLDTLVNLFDRVEKTLHPDATQYRLELTFEERNPYFGFFVRHVPEKLLSYFKCSFRSSINSDCRVEATKDAIYLDCPNNLTLSTVARGYLSLSSQMIASGKVG